MCNADDILSDLAKFDFPSAYRMRFSAFKTEETEVAVQLAICVTQEDLKSKESITAFLHDLWGHATNALDHGTCAHEQIAALKQLEIELCNMVCALRGQVLPHWK